MASVNPLENDCENANTLAHGGVHLVVLAHLQRRSGWRRKGGKTGDQTLAWPGLNPEGASPFRTQPWPKGAWSLLWTLA